MSYGYCPHCGAEAVDRERRMGGNDTCRAGHRYPSRLTLAAPPDSRIGRARELLDELASSLEDQSEGDPLTAGEAAVFAHRCKEMAKELA